MWFIINPDPNGNLKMTNTWRILKTPLQAGNWNMALDEAFLIHAANHSSPPTLRLYSWQRPTLSLGYSQPYSDIDQRNLDLLGWDCVRRPTGGRAILHTDELTYSVTAALDEPLVAGSLLESYQRISSALQHALDLLGAATRADQKYPNSTEQAKSNPVCFETPSNYEITWNGKKLIGSAQSRKSGGVLQHGSLPLIGDLTRITKALNYPSEPDRFAAGPKLLARACTLETALGRQVSWEEAASAFEMSFSSHVGLNLAFSEPSASEIELAEKLFADKYASKAWTERI